MSKQISKEKNKNGGPYTRKQQEERRIQVCHLHFEENMSAVKIAELLDVHRNTINEDIRFWHLQYANELKPQEMTSKMKKQIQRMEIQRDRFLEYMEEAKTLEEKIKVEKAISDIDNRLGQLYSRMIASGVKDLESSETLEHINEDEIKELVRDLVLTEGKSNSRNVYSEDEIKALLIQRTKCDMVHADNVTEKMRRDGLVLCMESMAFVRENILTVDRSQKYCIRKFAILRGYVTRDELASDKKPSQEENEKGGEMK